MSVTPDSLAPWAESFQCSEMSIGRLHGAKFYMYGEPQLDHSWLRYCKRFATLRHSVNDSNTAEVGVHKARAVP